MKATIAPAVRLTHSDPWAAVLISFACEPNCDGSNSRRHHRRLNGPLKGNVIAPKYPWNESTPIRMIGAYRKTRNAAKYVPRPHLAQSRRFRIATSELLAQVREPHDREHARDEGKHEPHGRGGAVG